MQNYQKKTLTLVVSIALAWINAAHAQTTYRLDQAPRYSESTGYGYDIADTPGKNGGLVEKRDCPDDGAGVGFADAGRKTGWRSRKATRGLTRGWYVSSNRRVVETLEGILLPFIICRNPECPEGTCTNDWHSPFGSNSVACRWKR